MSAMLVRLLPRTDLSTLRCCDALATSANAGLAGNANPNFWRFAGKRSADGALHRAAGPCLLAACEAFPLVSNVRCNISNAVVTPAFNLHSAVVIHAVAPDGLYAAGIQQWWGRRQRSGSPNAPAVHLEEATPASEANSLLEDTFTAIIEAARTEGVGSVGMPAVGSGVLSWEAGQAAKVAFGAFAKAALAYGGSGGGGGGGRLEHINVAFLDDAAFASWSSVARSLLGEPAIGEQGIETYDLRRGAGGLQLLSG